MSLSGLFGKQNCPCGAGAGGGAQDQVKSKSVSTPPGAPSVGDRYIVGSAATGVWTGHENDITEWAGAAWTFETPSVGWFVFIEDEGSTGEWFTWTGVEWALDSFHNHAFGGASHLASTLAEVNTKVSDASLAPEWVGAKVYYIGKHGNDGNDGKTPNKAFLTIGAAKAAAVALTPTTSNRFILRVVDGGEYDVGAAFTVPAWLTIYAPGALLKGAYYLDDDSAIVAREIDGNGEIAAVRKGDSTGTAYLRAQIVRNTGATKAAIAGVRGRLILDVDHIICPDHIGIQTSGLGDGVDGRVGTIEADTGILLAPQNTHTGTVSNLTVERIVATGEAVSFSQEASTFNLVVGHLEGADAYDVKFGSVLNLVVGNMVGNRVVTSGTANVSKAGGSAPLNGFPNRTDSTDPAMNGANLEIAPTGTRFSIWSDGQEIVKTGTDAVTISNDKTLHFVYYSALGVFTVSTTPWDLRADTVPVATVFKDGSNYIVTDERHGWRRDRDWHEWAHDTIGARYGSGFTGTFLDATFSLTQGVVHDEDIEFDSGGAKTDCQLWYRDVGVAAMRVELGVTEAYKQVAGVLQYDNAGVLTNATNQRYVNSYVYATNVTAYPVVVIVGQGQHTTLNSAQDEALPSILLSTAEWKLLYRATYRNVGGTPTFIEATDFRKTSCGPAPAAAATNHAGLIGREAASQHPATAISNTPAGSIAATDVQAAINELDSLPFNYIGGLITSNDTDTEHDIAIAAGAARAADDSADLRLPAVLTKQIELTWEVGDDKGGMEAADHPVQADTLYALWLIKRPDTGVVDAVFSLDFSAPTLPTNYTKKRLIAAVMTDGSNNIIGYTQVGDYFRYIGGVLVDVDDNTIESGVWETGVLSAPPRCLAHVYGFALNPTTTDLFAFVGLRTYGAADGVTTAQAWAFSEAADAVEGAAGIGQILVDASRRVEYRTIEGDGTSTVKVTTLGFTMLTRREP